MKVKQRPGDSDPPVKSLRHELTLHSPSYEFFRPEEIGNWHEDGVYQNLMEFEADLAGICRLVVVILESAGSFAELGAFSQLPELSEKLIVVKPSSFQDDSSFINLGILRFISNANSNSVKSYPWAFANHTGLLIVESHVPEDIVMDISRDLDRAIKSKRFQRDDRSHQFALICALVELFKAIKLSELKAYLRTFGLEIEDRKLKQKLFLLQSFKLVRRVQYSDSTYYVRDANVYDRFRFGMIEGRPLELTRLSVSCMDFYQANDKHRISALRQNPTDDSHE